MADPDCRFCPHRHSGNIAEWCQHPEVEPLSRSDLLPPGRALALYGTLCNGTRAPAWCPLREKES